MQDSALCVLPHVAHDLNSQIGAIIGHCDLALDSKEAVPQELIGHFKIIRALAANMADQIQKRQCPLGSARATKAAGT